MYLLMRMPSLLSFIVILPDVIGCGVLAQLYLVSCDRVLQEDGSRVHKFILRFGSEEGACTPLRAALLHLGVSHKVVLQTLGNERPLRE